MKVAIVGSRKYTNRRKIQEFVFKLKERWGDELEVVSGGQKDGADGYAKKFSLEFGVNYSEFPPNIISITNIVYWRVITMVENMLLGITIIGINK